MKAVTIREAQHNLAKVLLAVESGESVEILRRKTPIAQIVPIKGPSDASPSVSWDGHLSEMAQIWGDTTISNTDAVLDDLRDDR